MKKYGGNEHFDISEINGIYEGVTCQEIFLNKLVFVERYLPHTKPSLEILIFVGLNITPAVKYFGHFPYNLCKELGANISVVYGLGCSGIFNRHFRRFTQEEAEQQFIEGLKLARNFSGKVIIFSHSASTIEHLKLIFGDKYKNFIDEMNINIAGGIISATVTNIIIELRKVWPNYRFLNWRHLLQFGTLIDFPLPIYPYFSKARHAQDSSMNSLSVWINAKSSEFLLSTNIKKIILSGKTADYPLLVMLPRHDTLLDPIRQQRIYKYIAKKSKAALLRCDAEHNIFLSAHINPVFEAIREYAENLR